MTDQRVWPTAVRLAAFAAVMAVLLAGIVLVIKRPVAGPVDSFSGMFSDVSGLHTGDDVRMYGQSVGKVTSIALDGDHARVNFTTQRSHPLYLTSTLAVRYQNLAGQRYIDIRQPSSTGAHLGKGATVPMTQTVPSFDITDLFNGMQPVLADFSSADANQFLRNAAAVVEGDGSAVGATLAAIQKLSDYAVDKQQVITLLLSNFERLFRQVGGKSSAAQQMIAGVSDVFVNLQKQMEGLLDFVDTAPPVLGPLNTLLAAVGLTQPSNPDVSNDLRLLFPDPQKTANTLSRLPALVQSLTTALPSSATPAACSKGAAVTPPALQLLIRGQRVQICQR